MADKIDVEEVPHGLDSRGRGATWTKPMWMEYNLD
jgi:hypothetical protein